MMRRPPISTPLYSSAASDVYKRQGFFSWYNTEHRHSGIAYLTPEMVHYGHAKDIIDAMQVVLLEAYDAHPERFVNKRPRPLALPEAVWINRPERETESEVVLQ